MSAWRNFIRARRARSSGVATQFTELDNMLSGLQPSDLIILGARPSYGKTSLVLDIARQAATVSKKSVAIFSIEMSREQIIDRLISGQAQIPLWGFEPAD